MPAQSLVINDALSSESWGLARVIRRKAPWDVTRPAFPVSTFYEASRDGTGVDIYSLDSGVDTSHSEMAGRVVNVYDHFSTGGVHNGDDHGHGTAAMSAAAGNTLGTARGALIWSFKLYSSAGNTTIPAIQACLTQALNHYNSRSGTNRPAVVCANFAISDASFDTTLNAMIDAGMIIVCPVHNFGNNVDGSGIRPALINDTVAVGGVGFCDLPYYLGQSVDTLNTTQIGTGYGNSVDILAPAQSLKLARCSFLGGGYRVWSGNSFSCPFVAGIVACMLQGHSRRTTRAQVQAVISKLLSNATTGRLRPAFGFTPLADRIAYLNPSTTLETF